MHRAPVFLCITCLHMCSLLCNASPCCATPRLALPRNAGNCNFNGRDRSVSSDCGSERGSEGGGELRGMAFLPCSPMDRHSPGGGAHSRSSSAWDSPSPRRSGANGSGGGGSGTSSRRGSGVSSCLSMSSGSSSSPMCSPTGNGALLSAPILSDVPPVSGRGGGGIGRSSEKP